jgi:succinate-semialdehyde dehydrogenase / glutarate-semialdehyde dehydrogenase
VTITGQQVLEKKAFIGGEWVESESGERMEVFSPGDGSLVGTVPKCTKKDVQAAIDAAKEGLKAMEKISYLRRSDLFRKADKIARARAESDALIMCRESGKTIRESREEVDPYAIDHWIAAGEGIKRFRGVVNPFQQEDRLEKRIFIWHEPIGVVGVIGPWNWPMDIPNIGAAHAVAAGCSVVLKPASTTPFSVIALAEIFEEAGFPPGVVNVVTGPGSTVGEELVANPGTAAIHFTGSTETGIRLTQIAGVKRLCLELGGNGPLVIMDDANIDAAVAGAVLGCFYMAGQVCTASERILVHEKVHDEFVEKLVAAAGAIKVGDPLDETTDMGPIHNQQTVDQVQAHLDDARRHGGRFLCGGGIDRNWCEPTVIDGVTSDFLMAQKETFGPVAPIMTFSTIDEAIEIANETEYGLQGAAFTSSLRNAFLLAEGIKCGTVLINESNNSWDQLSPFGGRKQSGLGRELSDWIFSEVTEVKQMNLDIGAVK